jgi:hypothetical protein
MSDEKRLKSAYELAMERLRAEDREAGVEEAKPLTPRQKQKIAELRQNTKAKLAELEILHRKNLAAAQGDPAKIEELEDHHRVDRGRVQSALEEAVARVKRSKS